MREDASRAYLAPRLGQRSVSSYLCYARRVERLTGHDLDRIDLDDEGLTAIAARMVREEVPKASVRNSLAALRHYASMPARARSTESS